MIMLRVKYLVRKRSEEENYTQIQHEDQQKGGNITIARKAQINIQR